MSFLISPPVGPNPAMAFAVRMWRLSLVAAGLVSALQDTTPCPSAAATATGACPSADNGARETTRVRPHAFPTQARTSRALSEYERGVVSSSIHSQRTGITVPLDPRCLDASFVRAGGGGGDRFSHHWLDHEQHALPLVVVVVVVVVVAVGSSGAEEVVERGGGSSALRTVVSAAVQGVIRMPLRGSNKCIDESRTT